MKKWMFGLALLASAVASAQKYSNEFLSIGVGARAHGMGGSQVAHVGDVTAGYWNPAGLSRIGEQYKTDLQVAAMHAEWFGGIGKYDYAAVALPLPQQNHYLGLTFIRFGVDGIPNTLSLYNSDGTVNYDNITEFSAADYALMFGYARKFDSLGLSLGANAKIVHRSIGPFAKSWGFGVDLGAQYRKGDWRFGLMLRDITTTFNAWRFSFTDAEKQTLQLTGNEVPIQSLEITRPQIVLGASYQKDFPVGKANEAGKRAEMGVLASVDLITTTDGRRNTLIRSNPFSISPALGLELHYAHTVYLRAGMNNVQQFTRIDGSNSWAIQPNFGVGVRIARLRLDYGLANLGGSAGVLISHLVSARLDLDFDYFKRMMKDQ